MTHTYCFKVDTSHKLTQVFFKESKGLTKFFSTKAEKNKYVTWKPNKISIQMNKSKDKSELKKTDFPVHHQLVHQY